MKAIIFFVLLVTGIGCNKTRTNNNSRMELLADRTCRAVTMRQQRFELANKIRFTQDTLAQLKGKVDTARLQAKLKVYFAQKTMLTRESLALADTIHHQLDSLVPYTDKAAELRFNAQLDTLLVKKGCKGGTK